MTSSFSVNASVTTLDPLFENSTLAAIQLARIILEPLPFHDPISLAGCDFPQKSSISETVQDPGAIRSF